MKQAEHLGKDNDVKQGRIHLDGRGSTQVACRRAGVAMKRAEHLGKDIDVKKTPLHGQRAQQLGENVLEHKSDVKQSSGRPNEMKMNFGLHR